MSAFKHTVAIVTGAASGIGRQFAVELGRRRARVVVADIDDDGAAETAQLVRRAQGQAKVVHCDVRKVDALEALANATTEWAGEPDLVVLNAGVVSTGPLHTNATEDLERLVAVNVHGVVQGCRVFAGPMVARQRGSLLLVGSLAGLMPVPQLSAYAATKAAVVGLAQSLHAELRPHGVGVTVLCPSLTRTDLVRHGAASSPTVHRLGQRLLDTFGADPRDVANIGLRAAARGRLYALDTVHARVAWAIARAVPRLSVRVASLATRSLA